VAVGPASALGISEKKNNKRGDGIQKILKKKIVSPPLKFVYDEETCMCLAHVNNRDPCLHVTQQHL
jgi:hypothetical protein